MTEINAILPKETCWAYKNGSCSILNDCYCKKESNCHHYQTYGQLLETIRKCRLRLIKIGFNGRKYKETFNE